MQGVMDSGRLNQVESVATSPASRALSPLSDVSADEFQPRRRGPLPVCRKILGAGRRFQCTFCEKPLKTKKILKKHEIICSKNPSASRPQISCEACGILFARKDSLVKHNAKGRCVQEAKAPRHLCLFQGCQARFYHKTTLIQHLERSHEKTSKILPPQQLQFLDWDKFLSWKDEEEKQNHSYFSEQFGEKDGRTYFYCQQDGPRRINQVASAQLPSSNQSKKRKTCNLKGKMKTGFVCIAMMKVQKSETGVEVEYFPTHNHELLSADLKHQPLTNATNSYINNLLAIGASPRKILKTLQGDKFCRTNRSSVQKLVRNDFIKVKTLRERKRKMACSNRLASDDATAVHMQVQLLQEEEYSPVLIYKPFGHDVLYGPDSAKALNSDTFMLGIQTKEQAEMMEMASKTILIVDATHDMDQYGCQLLNVMGVDELNRGYPLAHCISSKMDEQTLKYFFEAIKARNPDLNINCVITDDDPALINSMNSGFVELLRHILCDWHFKRTLQRELHSKIKNSDLEDTMFKELCVIIDCLIESEFNQALKTFMNKYCAVIKTKSFIDYFRTYCIPKKLKWAKCFRRFPHGNVDTTMYVEAFHNILKTVYLKRKPNKRIDSLIRLILEIEEDYYRRRQTTICTVAPREQYMQCISARHLKGLSIDCTQVKQYDENGSKYWEVQSQTHLDQMYKVFRISLKCTLPGLCFFQCNTSECHQNLCAHMYMCTCPDEVLLCKHIHRVHSAFGESTVIDYKVSDEVEFYNEPAVDGMDTTCEQAAHDVTARLLQRKEKEKQEIRKYISELDEYVETDRVSNVLYPHLKGVLKGALALIRSVEDGDKHEETDALPQMTPSVQISSRAKLTCQMQPFEKKKKSKKELKRNLSKAPKLLEKIEIRKNLLANSLTEPADNASFMRYDNLISEKDPEKETDFDEHVPFCEEVETTSSLSQGKPVVTPKVQFVPRPIFVPGKSSSKIVDKQTPIV